MSNYSLKVNILGSDFTELGLPLYPKSSKEVKNSIPQLKGKVKNDYDLFAQSEQRSMSDVRDAIINDLGGVCSDANIAFDLDYEKGIPHTYKFMGMDINEDYQAVIPVGDGYVVVAEMFDRDEILNSNCEIDGTSLLHGTDPTDYEASVRFLKSCSSEFARKLSTAMKSGTLFKSYINADIASNDAVGPELVLDLAEIVDEYLSNKSSGSVLSFKSILLNLVHKSKEEVDKISGANSNKDASRAVLAQLFGYWHSVLKKYISVHKALSSIDLWQSVGKRLVGDKDFNSRLVDSVYLTDASGKVPGVAAISGVARNWDILDTNTNRESARTSFRELAYKVANPSRSVTLDSVKVLMLSNTEWENFENPYELSVDELQAVADYDSLKFIDEDVKVHSGAYDLNDPVERGMFIKSVAKSYDRNLREYQSREDYGSDLVNSMTELVDKRSEIKAGLVSDTTSFTPNQDDEDSTYNVTSSIEEINTAEIKKQMLKVSKLIRKNLENFSKSF